jgi:hypothetical protein
MLARRREIDSPYAASLGFTVMGNGVNHRRSQRLFLQVRVLIEGQIASKPNFAEESHTVVVNAHGALVEMSVPPDQGRTVTLKNVQTNEKQESKVILVTAGESGKFNVALEFTGPNPGFWNVTFPPDNWSIRHPDGKQNG